MKSFERPCKSMCLFIRNCLKQFKSLKGKSWAPARGQHLNFMVFQVMSFDFSSCLKNFPT